MNIITVKAPYAITIISRGAPSIVLVVAGHDGCCKIFAIKNNRLLSDPFWKLICGFLGGFPLNPFPFQLQYL